MKRSLLLISALLQILYWGPTLLYQVYYSIKMYNGSANSFVKVQLSMSITNNVIHIVVFYLFYLLLFPHLLYKKKFKEFILYSLLAIFVFTIGGMWLLELSVKSKPWYTYTSAFFYGLLNFSFVNLATGMLACVMRGFLSWIAEMKYKQLLEQKNLEASHALLKAQINPHFLFNTLNNIDVLIEKDAATASTYLKKLSDILRFTLYESSSDAIPLQQEINYMNQYIELQKIRTSNPDFVSFEVKSETENVFIAPMLFIPFIENAFKHCTNKKINNAIAISISVSEQVINFSCSNAYDTDALATQEKSGLGLELIQSRLHLLYKNNYKLATDKNAGRYNVTLSINNL